MSPDAEAATAALPGPVPGHPWAPDPSWPVLAPYWEHLAAGRLAFPACAGCGRFAWYPQPMCPRCQGMAFDWTPVEPVGRVFTHTILHRVFLPGFAETEPLPLVLVDVVGAPGVRLVTSTVDGDRTGLRVGADVRIEIREVAPGVHLPYGRVLDR